MQTVTVLFFATLRDKAGMKSTQIEVPPGMTVGALKEKMTTDIPALAHSMESVVVAVNREFAFDESVLPDRAEVAMFPPVSGG